MIVPQRSPPLASLSVKRQQLWHISLDVSPSCEDAVTVFLEQFFGVPASIYTDADTGRSIASVYLEKSSAWSAVRRKALGRGLANLREAGVDLGPTECHARRMRQEDWAESWKRHFKPMQIGRALLIKPSWSRKMARPGQKTIVLDPGLSFGTGQHPTTRFCLEQTAAARRPGQAQSFLDIGTGSGILAIAAAKLGTRELLGVDTDPIAVESTIANARRNGLTRQIHARRGSLPTGEGPFDLVLANLIASLLVRLADALRDETAPGGRLLASGIFRDREGDVRTAFEAAGLRLGRRWAEEDWVALEAVRA